MENNLTDITSKVAVAADNAALNNMCNSCNTSSTSITTSGYVWSSPSVVFPSGVSTAINTAYYPHFDDSVATISESISDIRKINEILDDVQKFCKEYCFMGLQEVCDSECKCDCPLWNRLKCEKRV